MKNCIECFFKLNKNLKGKFPNCIGKGTCEHCYITGVHLYEPKKKYGLKG